MTWEQRALQIWTVLIGCARRREIIRYEALAEMIGFDAPANRLSEPLGRVMRYCERMGFPPLTVLVVNQRGKPGEGLTTSQDFDQDRENVFAHPWFRETPIATQDLTQPWREQTRINTELSHYPKSETNPNLPMNQIQNQLDLCLEHLSFEF